MKKRYLAQLIGAALLSSSAVVSAAGPTVFGQLHLSVDSFENDAFGATAANEQGFLSSNFSRVGVKGDGEIEGTGGMKYVYQVLAPLRADDGVDGLGATLYDTFVGVSSDFGTVRAGRMDTPVKDLSAIFNQFGTRVGDSRNIAGIGGTLIFDNRFSNAVRYDSPKFGPVTFSALYGSSENTAYSSSSTDAGSANVRWSDMGFTVGLGYEQHNTVASEDETIVRLVGSYKFSDITVAAMYEKMTDLGGVVDANRDVFGIAGAYKFGSNTVKLHYVKADKVETAATDNGADMIAVGFDHELNKAVLLYVVYAQVDNDDGGTFKTAGAGAHGNSLAVTAGVDQTGLSAGVVVSF